MTTEVRRRHDDVVSYSEMVDYTSGAIEDFHRSRSETLVLSVDVAQVGSTAAGADLVVQVNLS